jgi:hypothetical protein
LKSVFESLNLLLFALHNAFEQCVGVELFEHLEGVFEGVDVVFEAFDFLRVFYVFGDDNLHIVL